MAIAARLHGNLFLQRDAKTFMEKVYESLNDVKDVGAPTKNIICRCHDCEDRIDDIGDRIEYVWMGQDGASGSSNICEHKWQIQLCNNRTYKHNRIVIYFSIEDAIEFRNDLRCPK
ncbi:MAG: hypothetical protein WAM14_01495 [Candidatus Nitrosopolaris sp.]